MSDDHGEHGGDGHGDEHGGGEEHGGDEHGGEHGGEHGEGGGPVGQIAGGVSGALGGIADALGDGEDTKEAREALETASDIAEGVGDAAETAENLGDAIGDIQSGDIGGAAGNLGGALGSAGSGINSITGGLGNAIGGEAGQTLREVGRVANTVGQVARGVGQIVEGATELLEGLLGERHPVHFELEISGEDTQFTVRHIHLNEALGELYDGTVEATFGADAHLDEEELLSKDVSLAIERGDEVRHFRGIIRHASIRRVQEHQVIHLDIAPALWLAAETMDSRVYQDISVPDLVEQIIEELLGTRNRTVKRELTESYEAHEYLVQHRESHFEFISRLLREEGIFFYFDHDEDDAEHEVFVMGDSNSNRPLVRPSHDGVIEFEEQENRREGREVAFHVHRHHRIGATDAVVRGYDWTNPSLNVHHERTERGNWNGPALEVYDHHHAVRHHGYDEGGGSYQSHTADRYSRHHTERLDIARNRYSVGTTVVTAQPGHIFELQGADIHDGRYLIIRMSASGEAAEHGGTYHNSLDVIPEDTPYRPPAPERRYMPGPETATVVGPAGEEIHTDRHGRIKVQFHWDRQGQNDEHSSAWIRVMQSWAGPGWGFVFIPRIGMEVIVNFLGGDPDRPIVTGCVYNGTNTPPYPLPDEKTKSTIKTNSSLGGGGSNELRFEDKAGSEEVYIHAQKDFNEVVENNHSTHVKNNQTNTVDNDQTETVGNNQKMTVKVNREKTVKGDETTIIGPDSGNRTETVHGDELVMIKGTRKHSVKLDEMLLVEEGKRKVTVQTGKTDEYYGGGRNVEVSKFNNLKVIDDANYNVVVSGQHNVKVDGPHYRLTQGDTERVVMTNSKTYVESASEVQLRSGDSQLVLTQDGTIIMKGGKKIALECGSSKIELKADGTITIEGTSVQVKGSEALVKLEAAGSTLKGPKVDVLADMFTTIKGTLVRIN